MKKMAEMESRGEDEDLKSLATEAITNEDRLGTQNHGDSESSNELIGKGKNKQHCKVK